MSRHVPLSPDMQAMVVSHRPFAAALAKSFLRRRPYLHHRREEVLAEADYGLVRTALTWDPSRGVFAQAAFWWVRSRLWSFTSRQARVVSAPYRDGAWVEDYSLDAPVWEGDGRKTWVDLLEDATDREDALAALEVWRQSHAYLVAVQERPRTGKRATATHTTEVAELYLRTRAVGPRADCGAVKKASAQLGIASRTIDNRLRRLDDSFGRVAHSISKQAA